MRQLTAVELMLVAGGSSLNTIDVTGPGSYDPGDNPSYPDPGSSGGGYGGGGSGGDPDSNAETIFVDGKRIRYDMDFISNHEGGRRLEAYVPQENGHVIGDSGVTVATGVDLGKHSYAELKSILDRYWGMNPPNKAYPNIYRSEIQAKNDSYAALEAMRPYIGLHGNEALQYEKNHPLVISDRLSRIFDEGIQTSLISTLVGKFDAQSSKDFSDLPSTVQTVIIDVAHQYGPNLDNAKHGTPNFWRQITSGDWEGAYRNLMNFGDDYPSRRHDEAALLKHAMDSGQLK